MSFESSSDSDSDFVPSEPLDLTWVDLTDLGLHPNALALSELPGAKFRTIRRDLRRDLSTLTELGFTDVICLLTKSEFRKFRVKDLLVEYANHGLHCSHFPIEDGMAPDVADIEAILTEVIANIHGGHKVLIHCFGGVGRSGVVAACLMLRMASNLTSDEVIRRLRQVRGPRTIQSVKQFNFVNDYRELREEYLKQEEEEDLSR